MSSTTSTSPSFHIFPYKIELFGCSSLTTMLSPAATVDQLLIGNMLPDYIVATQEYYFTGDMCSTWFISRSLLQLCGQASDVPSEERSHS